MSDPRPAGRRDPVAERHKLAHTLGVAVDELTMLSALAAEDVRALRLQVGEALFQADRHHFVRVATLAKTVPAAVAAKLTEATLPPLLAARTAELLDPRRAVEMVGKLSRRYLADVSAVMDAARAKDVVRAMPPATVAAVGSELARREEWVVMGGFVAHVNDEALRASVAELDGEQLLRVSFVLEDLDRLDPIGGMLTDRQLDEMLRAAPGAGLWREFDELVANLLEPRVQRMAAAFAGLAEDVRAEFAAARDRGELRSGTHAALTAQTAGPSAR